MSVCGFCKGTKEIGRHGDKIILVPFFEILNRMTEGSPKISTLGNICLALERKRVQRIQCPMCDGSGRGSTITQVEST